MWRSAGVRRNSDARIFCADGVYAVTHEFSENFARGKSAPTEAAVLEALSKMRRGVAYTAYAPGRRFPQDLASATSGGLALVCSPDGAPFDEVFGRGRHASAMEISLVVGGPKGFSPYTASDVLRFTGSRDERAMVSVGTEMQFASAIIAYVRVRMDGAREGRRERGVVKLRTSRRLPLLIPIAWNLTEWESRGNHIAHISTYVSVSLDIRGAARYFSLLSSATDRI